MKRKISVINKKLVQRFGVPERRETSDPVDMLIATILSQNTNDKNSYRAFRNLKDKYDNWEKIAEEPRIKIEKQIKIAGLGKQKSAAIKNFLSSVKKENGKVSLKYLKDFSNDEILSELTKYDGVGVKTASCVLLFSLKRNICPVDTHVHRTLNRIGIVNTKTPDKTFLAIKDKIPEGIAHSFHTNLIRLGREICKPAKPNCSVCPLLKICSYDNKNLNSSKKTKENSFMLLDNV
ncbi:MAG: endonuclease III [Ignavibacteriaceae bacterium]